MFLVGLRSAADVNVLLRYAKPCTCLRPPKLVVPVAVLSMDIPGWVDLFGALAR